MAIDDLSVAYSKRSGDIDICTAKTKTAGSSDPAVPQNSLRLSLRLTTQAPVQFENSQLAFFAGAGVGPTFFWMARFSSRARGDSRSALTLSK